jgi:hypothetical protein
MCVKALRATADLLRGAQRGGANTRGRDLTRAVQASQHLLKVTVQMLRIRFRRIRMFLGLLDPDPDPVVRGTDPNPSIIKQNYLKTLIPTVVCFFMTIKQKKL